MDDGSKRNDANSGKLATQGFPKEDQVLLQEYIRKFGIETSLVIHSQEKNQFSLNILSTDNHFENFKQLISPTVLEVPCMHYKIQ